MVEQDLRDLLELAGKRLEATDDPHRREKLTLGIDVGEEVGSLLKARALLCPTTSEDVSDLVDAMWRLIVAKTGEMLLYFGEGELFGGDDGRTDDKFGLGSQD